MKKRIILTVIAVILVIAFGCGYRNINQKYPRSVIKLTPKGTEASIQDKIYITIEDSRFLSDKEMAEMFKKTEYTPPFEIKILDITATLENRSEEIKRADLTSLYIESPGGGNGISKSMVDASGGSVGPELQAGEKKKITIYYEILSTDFKKRVWKNIENREFWITYAQYPEKKILELK